MSEPSTSIATRDEPRKAGDPWFPDSFYSMSGDSGMMELAQNAKLGADLRLQWACMARANKWGHAAFGEGELRNLLGVPRATLNKAIRTLVAGGVAAPESNRRCIVLSAYFYRRGDRKTKPCTDTLHPGTEDRMWVSKIGWEPKPGHWQWWLNEPDGARQIAECRTRTVTERIVIDRTTTEQTVRIVPAAGVDPSLIALAEYENPDYEAPARGQRKLYRRALASG